MIKVFIIDDSRLMRKTIRGILRDYGDIEVIGEAPNPVDAFEVFKQVGLPDLFILDIEMPKMDGITFLKQIRDQKPIPTVILSAVVSDGSTNAIRALALGACDVVSKPKTNDRLEREEFVEEFIAKIRACARSKHVSITAARPEYKQPLKSTNKVVAIGASTGGVQALASILPDLVSNHSPIVITQHMPAGFTTSFARRLNRICPHSHVREAGDGDTLLPGQILIAPGAKHLEVLLAGKNQYKAVLKNYPKVSSHKPSVDVLFTSLAKAAKSNAVAIILTGMGKDGALGIKKVKAAGGKTYGQDEATSVVYGMPKAAYEIGGVSRQIPMNAVATIINNIR